jgi:hypothetical protein
MFTVIGSWISTWGYRRAGAAGAILPPPMRAILRKPFTEG